MGSNRRVSKTNTRENKNFFLSNKKDEKFKLNFLKTFFPKNSLSKLQFQASNFQPLKKCLNNYGKPKNRSNTTTWTSRRMTDESSPCTSGSTAKVPSDANLEP